MTYKYRITATGPAAESLADTGWPQLEAEMTFAEVPDSAVSLEWYGRPGLVPESPCRVYWGSHGCSFERGHEGTCECDCCECGSHPDPDPGNPGCAPSCVAKVPYYGPETRFYGEDAAARGLRLVECGGST